LEDNNYITKFNRTDLIGKMAASVVHEIRNPITSVKGFVQLLKNKIIMEEYSDYFNLIIEELDRANEILTEYLSLARDKKDADLQRQDINEILTALLPLLRADAIKAGKNVLLQTGEINELWVDPKDIRQVVLNLARNGLEAMAKGGTLEIRTYMEEEFVVLEVKDSGCGIPEDIMNNLGAPFVSTKENGTGLGLFVCLKILDTYKATVTVDSSSQGTNFIIRFPHEDGVLSHSSECC
jgi:two-component system, sporulation sensor kinase E